MPRPTLPPGQRRKHFSCHLHPDDRERLEDLAHHLDCTLSQALVWAVKRAHKPSMRTARLSAQQETPCQD